jgi:hypothetical protein
MSSVSQDSSVTVVRSGLVDLVLITRSEPVQLGQYNEWLLARCDIQLQSVSLNNSLVAAGHGLHITGFAEFEFLTMVVVNSFIFWDTMPRSSACHLLSQ